MDFYQTPIHPCGYITNRYSVNIFADPNAELSTRTYSWLIDRGFRRNGSNLYKPHCPDCKACVPTRVAVNNFKLSRSQKRVLARNQDLNVQEIQKAFVQEHFDLYKCYLEDRTKLICVAVFDNLPQGLSAAYTFFDTAYQNRSLGTLAILKLIEHAKINNLEYVYLGYWIKECQKMSYKSNFRPVEGFIDKHWQEIESSS